MLLAHEVAWPALFTDEEGGRGGRTNKEAQGRTADGLRNWASLGSPLPSSASHSGSRDIPERAEGFNRLPLGPHHPHAQSSEPHEKQEEGEGIFQW